MHVSYDNCSYAQDVCEAAERLGDFWMPKTLNIVRKRIQNEQDRTNFEQIAEVESFNDGPNEQFTGVNLFNDGKMNNSQG